LKAVSQNCQGKFYFCSKLEDFKVFFNLLSLTFCSFRISSVQVRKLELTTEQYVFKIAVDYRGRRRKGITIYNATEVIFYWSKNTFKPFKKAKTTKIFRNDNFLCSVYLSRAALYELLLAIHKDVLFHS
jgi:hypothetical protein